MKSKICIIKLDEALFSEIIYGEMSNYLYDNYYNLLSYETTLSQKITGKTVDNIFLQYLLVDADIENNILCIDAKNDVRWHEQDFISNHLQNILDENGIKSNFIYGKINTIKIQNILKNHLLMCKITGIPKKNRKIFSTHFFGTLGKDFSCIIILSNGNVNEKIQSKNADEDFCFSYGDFDRIKPSKILSFPL